MKYISCFNLTEWQLSKIEEIATSVKMREFQGHKIYAIGYEPNKYETLCDLIELENIHCLTKQDHFKP